MPISYTIAMPQPHTHLYHVTLEVDGVEGAALDVALPAWTPGSYMIREYARHVQEFAAFAVPAAAGPERHQEAERSVTSLPWRKLDKATWRIETGAAASVRISYHVYAYELSVRTSHLDGTHGFFNPATLCMYIPGRTAEPLTVHVLTPAGWRVTTGLETLKAKRETMNEAADAGSSAFSLYRSAFADAGSSAFNLYRSAFIARDYDELVDSPFECGDHRLLEFEVGGIAHRIALWGHGNQDERRLVEDTKAIVEAARALFGGLPYDRYTFIVHLSDGRGGGLEHRNSTALLVDRWTFQPRTSYERYLALTSHEFFHVWNVKRIRAEPLGPFDYSGENYTRQLWAMEGVTEYYTDLLLLRAGLIGPARYLELLAAKIVQLQSQPGRALTSLEQSSFDAWIKYYRPDENTLNSTISYYLKGCLVALLLDLELRHRTAGARSLDDVLRYLSDRFPLDGPGIPEDGGYRAAVEAVAGEAGPFAEFFERYVAGTAELDYARALGYAGLRLEWHYEQEPLPGGTPAWLGIRLKTEYGRSRVSQVLADGPAYAAGVYAGDELLALDGFRVDEERLKARLAEHASGDAATLSLFRRDQLLHIAVTLAAAPPDKLAIVKQDEASAAQQKLYAGWIGELGEN